MKFKFIPNKLREQVNNIFNKNERLATNVVPTLPTSKFDKSFRHMNTFDSGKLIPIFCDEVLPGDIFNIDVSTIIRLSTPQAATMENAIYDVAFFYVPNRLVWPAWKYFFGENKSAGFQKNYKFVPKIIYDKRAIYGPNDLASYLGFPQNKDFSKISVPINSLYFKAYVQIYNDYFREENIQSEADNTNNNNLDGNVVYSNYCSSAFNMSLQVGKKLAPVRRLTDYFSTCLPFPQKGDSVNINNIPLDKLVVNGGSIVNSSTAEFNSPYWYSGSGSKLDNRWYLKSGSSGNTTYQKDSSSSDNGTAFFRLSLENGTIEQKGNIPLYSINDLRLAIAMQHFRELDARGGTRYTEMLLNHFGVVSSDARLQRAEYIGGFRSNIDIQNVVQSSSGPEHSPLGSIGGVSVSNGKSPRTIRYAAEESGIIMGFVIVRPQVNYSQGLDKKFTRVEKMDYYFPDYANIGEQPVYKYELFLDDTDGSNNTNNEIFGYNEAWADYRYSKNLLTGYLSVNNELSLASLYAYTEKYSNAPYLNADWYVCNSDIIGQTLAVNKESSGTNVEYVHQFLGDFYFNCYVDRRMPVYSIPGIDKL